MAAPLVERVLTRPTATMSQVSGSLNKVVRDVEAVRTLVSAGVARVCTVQLAHAAELLLAAEPLPLPLLQGAIAYGLPEAITAAPPLAEPWAAATTTRRCESWPLGRRWSSCNPPRGRPSMIEW